MSATLDAYRHHLDRKGFRVSQEIGAGLPAVHLDADAVAGALINLLGNAMKFSRERKEVTVRLYQATDDLILCCSISGRPAGRPYRILRVSRQTSRVPSGRRDPRLVTIFYTV